MKTAFSTAGFIAGVLALANVASAQTYVSPAIAYGGYGGYGYYPGYGYHASTYEQGVLEGYAAVLQAQGQGNYYNSLAAINYQDARSRLIQNDKNAVERFFYVRQANQSARKPVRLSTEKLTELARAAAPDRLTPQDYDSTLGRLHWPVALMSDDFAAERDALEQLFRSRSPGDSGAGSAFYADVRELTSTMEQKLRDHLQDFDTAQYMTAKKFLVGVAYESQHPMVAASLAVR